MRRDLSKQMKNIVDDPIRMVGAMAEHEFEQRHMREQSVSMRGEIEIDRPATAVFAFVTDGGKDPSWRTEVYRMDVTGIPAVGAEWTEYSRFFLGRETVTPTTITDYAPPFRVVLETSQTHPYWLQSVREVVPLSESRSRLVYVLAFDPAAMRQLLPFTPPIWLIKKWYTPRIQKFLRNAKRLLEFELRGEKPNA